MGIGVIIDRCIPVSGDVGCSTSGASPDVGITERGSSIDEWLPHRACGAATDMRWRGRDVRCGGMRSDGRSATDVGRCCYVRGRGTAGMRGDGRSAADVGRGCYVRGRATPGVGGHGRSAARMDRCRCMGRRAPADVRDCTPASRTVNHSAGGRSVASTVDSAPAPETSGKALTCAAGTDQAADRYQIHPGNALHD